MKIRYFFSDGSFLESIPNKTTLANFGNAVTDMLRYGEIVNIQFLEN